MTTDVTDLDSLTDIDGYVDVRWIDLCERLVTEFPAVPHGTILDAMAGAYRAASMLGVDRRNQMGLATLIARDAMLALDADAPPRAASR